MDEFLGCCLFCCAVYTLFTTIIPEGVEASQLEEAYTICEKNGGFKSIELDVVSFDAECKNGVVKTILSFKKEG